MVVFRGQVLGSCEKARGGVILLVCKLNGRVRQPLDPVREWEFEFNFPGSLISTFPVLTDILRGKAGSYPHNTMRVYIRGSFLVTTWKIDRRLPGQEDSNSRGARPVY